MATVVLAGATGDLGGRILRELLALKATVRVLIRKPLDATERSALAHANIEIHLVDFNSKENLTSACGGADVVISALSGLEDVIVKAQTQLLNAAVAAKVPRFIPSDFAIDFRAVPAGENRNLNLREDFRKTLDRAEIRATSVLNGAFMDMLTGQAPFILFKRKRILCFGNPNQKMDFTTKDNAARFTAFAALDPETPRFLKVAGDSLSARDLAQIMTSIENVQYKVLRPGGLWLLKTIIAIAKRLQPAPHETYPAWQGMQYMYAMYKGDARLTDLDNSRYDIKWTKAEELLRKEKVVEAPGIEPGSAKRSY